MMQKLSHPNIPKLYEIFESEDYYYLIMDKAKLNLLQYLCSYEKLDMPFDQVVQLMYDLLNVLNYLAEKGIMHRDIKPENIMLSLNSNKEIEKCFLIDFGFAAFQRDAPYYYFQCGSPGYIAPEIGAGKDRSKPYDIVCDIFSLGAVFYLLYISFF